MARACVSYCLHFCYSTRRASRSRRFPGALRGTSQQPPATSLVLATSLPSTSTRADSHPVLEGDMAFPAVTRAQGAGPAVILNPRQEII